MEYNELTHHGTKGMRWGIRRYQNKDGSLTPAGRKRYGSDSVETPEQKAQREAAERAAKKAAVLNSRSAKKLYDNADLFTTEELQKATYRLQLEKNIKDLDRNTVSDGEARVKKLIENGKTANDLISTGTKMYNMVATIYNSLTKSGRNKPIPLIEKAEKKKDDKSDKKDNLSNDLLSDLEETIGKYEKRSDASVTDGAKAVYNSTKDTVGGAAKTVKDSYNRAKEREAQRSENRASKAERKAEKKAARKAARRSSTTNAHTDKSDDVLSMHQDADGTWIYSNPQRTSTGKDKVSGISDSKTSRIVTDDNVAAGRDWIEDFNRRWGN